jgi:hypothetical protein
MRPQRRLPALLDALLFAATVGVVLYVLIGTCCGAEASPRARVVVLHAWLQLAAETSPAAAAPPDLFAPYEPPATTAADQPPARGLLPDQATRETPIVVEEAPAVTFESDGGDAPLWAEANEPAEEFPELFDLAAALRLALPRQCLFVFTQANCGPCAAYHDRELGELYDAGFPIIFVRVDWPTGQALTQYFGVNATPTTVATDFGVEVGRIEGRPASAKAVTDLFRTQQSAPAATPPPAKPKAKPPRDLSTSCRWVYGQWTWPGCPSSTKLRRHLCGPPHNMAAGLVAGLTPNQLVAAHDAWHNAHGGGGGGRRAGRRDRRRAALPLPLAPVCLAAL